MFCCSITTKAMLSGSDANKVYIYGYLMLLYAARCNLTLRLSRRHFALTQSHAPTATLTDLCCSALARGRVVGQIDDLLVLGGRRLATLGQLVLLRLEPDAFILAGPAHGAGLLDKFCHPLTIVLDVLKEFDVVGPPGASERENGNLESEYKDEKQHECTPPLDAATNVEEKVLPDVVGAGIIGLRDAREEDVKGEPANDGDGVGEYGNGGDVVHLDEATDC